MDSSLVKDKLRMTHCQKFTPKFVIANEPSGEVWQSTCYNRLPRLDFVKSRNDGIIKATLKAFKRL